MQTKRAMCFWCNPRCRVAVRVENNHLVSVEEDPDSPNPVWPSTGACVRRVAAREWFYHPDRVNYALKRTGERGQGKWTQVPWEQAMDEIAHKLSDVKEKYGAEALATTQGTLRTHDEYRGRFFNLFGSPNIIGQGTICYGPQQIVSNALVGWCSRRIRSGETKGYLLWGRTPENSFPSYWFEIRNVKKDGKKLIVVDPRYTESAALADLYLQPRPGTDGALILSMISVIINEGLYNKEFVTQWCYGFEQVGRRVQEYPPEKVADITGVPANKIREAARLYASMKPAIIIPGMGIEHLENAAGFIHGRYILSAITGNVNVEGGEIASGPHPKLVSENEVELCDMLPPEQRKKQIGSDRFRLFTWPGYEMVRQNMLRVWGNAPGYAHMCQATAPLVYRAMITGEPYPVKALITLSSNPMVTQGNTKLVYHALKKLDLYVVVDFWRTPSAELADYVLPAASWLERPQLHTYMGNAPDIVAGERALPASLPGEYDHHTDFEFWRGLGLRLGQEKWWPWKTLEEAYDDRLKPLGFTLEEFMRRGGKDKPPIDLKKYEKVGWATPTGKIELYSTIFEKLGYDPLPAYQEPAESLVSRPDLAADYPLMLITGARHRPFIHSEHRQIDSLRRRHPDPIVQIHPDTASGLGIKEGDWVWIETPRGRVRQRCRYFEGMNPKVVSAQHGWWFPELPGEEPWLHGVWESNINVCTDDEPDHLAPLLGGWPLRTALCKVYRVKDYR